MDSTKTPDQKAKATFDPGWNDPPQFSYNAHKPTPGRPRNYLNKRVAFPLGNTTTSPLQVGPMSLPPMPTTPLIPSMPPLLPAQPSQSLECENDIDSEKTLKEVMEILLTFLDSSTALGPKVNDIKRRLKVMEEMWLNNKLDKNIQRQMMELACALRDATPRKADHIHQALMVDHVSSVGTWMPGIKQLIHHCIARFELLDIDKEQPDGADNEI